MIRKTSLKTELEVLEESLELFDSSNEQIPNIESMSLQSEFTPVFSGDGHEDVNEQYDISETKGLLPPLPTTSTKNETDSESLKSQLTPTKQHSRGPSFHKTLFNSASASHQSISSLNTPNQIETALSSINTSLSLPSASRTASVSSPSVLQSPKRSRIDENNKEDLLTYSPAIANDNFEISLDIPINSVSTPRTLEEKIRLYENVQRQEMNEFDKTLQNFKKSGWMTEKELKQLEISKVENFNKWEAKIKDLKLRKKAATSSIVSPYQSNNTTPGTPSSFISDDYFRQPKAPSTPPLSHQSSGLYGSSSLQKLEQKFNSMEMQNRS